MLMIMWFLFLIIVFKTAIAFVSNKLNKKNFLPISGFRFSIAIIQKKIINNTKIIIFFRV